MLCCVFSWALLQVARAEVLALRGVQAELMVPQAKPLAPQVMRAVPHQVTQLAPQGAPHPSAGVPPDGSPTAAAAADPNPGWLAELEATVLLDLGLPSSLLPGL